MAVVKPVDTLQPYAEKNKKQAENDRVVAIPKEVPGRFKAIRLWVTKTGYLKTPGLVKGKINQKPPVVPVGWHLFDPSRQTSQNHLNPLKKPLKTS